MKLPNYLVHVDCYWTWIFKEKTLNFGGQSEGQPFLGILGHLLYNRTKKRLEKSEFSLEFFFAFDIPVSLYSMRHIYKI